MRRDPERAGGRRGRGEAGAALVEFAFVMALLFTLVFGIISFGLMLSFKQDVTRAAAEGARAGAVALPSDTAETKAQLALEDAVRKFGGSTWTTDGCSRVGVTSCTASVAECANEPGVECVTVTFTFDYDQYPLYGDIPLMSAFLPDQISATSVARIN